MFYFFQFLSRLLQTDDRREARPFLIGCVIVLLVLAALVTWLRFGMPLLGCAAGWTP